MIPKVKTGRKAWNPCCIFVAAMTLILASFVVLPQLLPQNFRYKVAAEVAYRLAAHLHSPETPELILKHVNDRILNSTDYIWDKTTQPFNKSLTNSGGGTFGGNESKEGDQKRYLVYMCDDKEYCYGLGDRQRGIVSVYLLAELTNRTFGIIMTSPSNFTEFYKPRLVNWDIPWSELEGKSFNELKALGPQADIKLNRTDFNVEYPQDVVYIRTNQKFHYSLQKNPFYKDRFPKWAQVPHWKLYQDGWMRLMAPTVELRQDLNEMLIRILQGMEEEQRAWHVLKQTGCCETVNTSTNGGVHVPSGEINEQRNAAENIQENKTCLEQKNTNCVLHDTKFLLPCTNSTQHCIYNCTKNISNCTSEKTFTNLLQEETMSSNNSRLCVEILLREFKNSTAKSGLSSIAKNLCHSSLSIIPKQPNVTVERIRRLKDYDLLDMNLVCAHIRLGHSSSMPFETNVRNKPGEEKVVWEFLKPYVTNGHHVYMATDSEQIRQKAKILFGYRLHISSLPIVHIASVQKGQDKRQGFRLALMEQLLLATSCSVLMVSYSGFSMKAAQIRHVLRPEADSLFIYRSGKVLPVKIHRLQ